MRALRREVLAMIRKCNIRNFSIFLRMGCGSAIFSTTEQIMTPRWRKCRLAARHDDAAQA